MDVAQPMAQWARRMRGLLQGSSSCGGLQGQGNGLRTARKNTPNPPPTQPARLVHGRLALLVGLEHAAQLCHPLVRRPVL